MELIVSTVFVRHLMGSVRKVLFFLYCRRNVATAKSANLFNGKIQLLSKTFAKDRCLFLVCDSEKFFGVKS